ncbi:MAG: hypothetical protein PHV68_01260 [Candidatus Gastranaerophilales bacterium]|nr:hypothetical protein [Candidatus Gastranaerophilales bacterium]
MQISAISFGKSNQDKKSSPVATGAKIGAGVGAASIIVPTAIGGYQIKKALANADAAKEIITSFEQQGFEIKGINQFFKETFKTAPVKFTAGIAAGVAIFVGIPTAIGAGLGAGIGAIVKAVKKD